VFLNNSVSTYQISEAPLEAINFPVPLFLRPAFINANTHRNFITVQCRSISNNELVAFVVFALEGNKAVSLPASPFGSFCSKKDFSLQEAIHFVKETKKILAAKHCQHIEVKHYPACYGQHTHDVFLQAMLSNDFKIKYKETNQYISVSEKLFVDGLHDSAKRRLKKCYDAGFVVEIANHFNAEEWFDRIVRARKLKGHPLTTDLQSLRSINKVGSSHYHFVSVKDMDKTIASAIAIEVTPETLYFYLPADEESYLQYSPMIMLIEALYNLAQSKKMSILDLGISSSEGIINEGLRKFKNNLGAQEEFKTILTSSVSHVS
jgi:hypothetical protein